MTPPSTGPHAGSWGSVSISPGSHQSGGLGCWAHRGFVCLSNTGLSFRMAVHPHWVLPSPSVRPAVCLTVCLVPGVAQLAQLSGFKAFLLRTLPPPPIALSDFWLLELPSFRRTLQALITCGCERLQTSPVCQLPTNCPGTFSELTIFAFEVSLMRTFRRPKPQRPHLPPSAVPLRLPPAPGPSFPETLLATRAPRTRGCAVMLPLLCGFPQPSARARLLPPGPAGLSLFGKIPPTSGRLCPCAPGSSPQPRARAVVLPIPVGCLALSQGKSAHFTLLLES